MVAPVRVIIQQPALPGYRIPVFRELARRPGIQLTVAYGDGDVLGLANVEPDGFDATFDHIHHFRFGQSELLWHSPQLRDATRKHADILVLSWNLHHITLFPALLRARANGVKTVLWGHGYSKQDAPWRASLRHRAARLADAVLFYNFASARSHILRGLPPERAFVALNALDQSCIQAARSHWLARPDELCAFQHQHNLHGRPVILFVSRLDPANRLDLLLQALAQPSPLPIAPTLVIVGKGADEPNLRALASSLNIADRVVFVGAIYDEQQIAPYFLSSQVFCYPSNIGLSVLHAFGYGLPVVTSDNFEGQNPEIEAFVHNANGLLYHHNDPAALAATLHRLLADHTLRNRFAAAAHRTAIEHFTLENMVDGMEAAIRYALSPSPTRMEAVPSDRHSNRQKVADASAHAQAQPLESACAPLKHDVTNLSTSAPARGSTPSGQTSVALAHATARGSHPYPRPLRLAIIANANAPYRQHQHLRIAREMPEVELWSVFTHDVSNAPWTLNAPAEIRPVLFGSGESAEKQGHLSHAFHEYRKGGRIIGWLRDQAIDVVLVLGYNDIGRVRIINWCHGHKVPILLWGDSNIRGDQPTGLRRKIKQRLLTRLLAKCSGVLPCGQLGMEYFARYGVPRDRMFLFTLEPDYSLIENLPDTVTEQVADRFSIDRTRHRIIYSGRLVKEKRVDLLINAFARIADQRPDWDLLIVGNGPLRNELGQLVPAHLRSRVIWPGFLGDQRYVTAFYKLADVLVLPSDYEPWALVINEAAAAGLAIIASDVVGAAAELVQEGVNGHTFPAGDLESLIRALADATDPTSTARMKEASRDILAQWRRDADPITTLRACLRLTR